MSDTTKARNLALAILIDEEWVWTFDWCEACAGTGYRRSRSDRRCPKCNGSGGSRLLEPKPLDEPEQTLRLVEWAGKQPWWLFGEAVAPAVREVYSLTIYGSICDDSTELFAAEFAALRIFNFVADAALGKETS